MRRLQPHAKDIVEMWFQALSSRRTIGITLLYISLYKLFTPTNWNAEIHWDWSIIRPFHWLYCIILTQTTIPPSHWSDTTTMYPPGQPPTTKERKASNFLPPAQLIPGWKRDLACSRHITNPWGTLRIKVWKANCSWGLSGGIRQLRLEHPGLGRWWGCPTQKCKYDVQHSYRFLERSGGDEAAEESHENFLSRLVCEARPSRWGGCYRYSRTGDLPSGQGMEEVFRYLFTTMPPNINNAEWMIDQDKSQTTNFDMQVSTRWCYSIQCARDTS